jgi:hypothetical protein
VTRSVERLGLPLPPGARPATSVTHRSVFGVHGGARGEPLRPGRLCAGGRACTSALHRPETTICGGVCRCGTEVVSLSVLALCLSLVSNDGISTGLTPLQRGHSRRAGVVNDSRVDSAGAVFEDGASPSPGAIDPGARRICGVPVGPGLSPTRQPGPSLMSAPSEVSLPEVRRKAESLGVLSNRREQLRRPTP